jgi:hypothetical protein
MKHFFIYFIAFFIVLTLAVFNYFFFFSGYFSAESGEPVSGRTLQGIDSNNKSNDGASQTPVTTTPPTADAFAEEISIDSPESNSVISSPLEISGTAKSSWFFEGSFPIKLINDKGEIIAAGNANAKADWTASGSVPFEAELEFTAPTSTLGMLIFASDNNSGLSENEKEFGVPVKFNDTKQVTVKVYFLNSDLQKDSNNCWEVFPVQRLIDKTSTITRATVEQLLAGATDKEKAQGYSTAINDGVKINSLTIDKQGTAKVDFDSQIENGVAGSCKTSAIKAQIIQTIQQFPSVKKVVISVDGNINGSLQP